MAETATATEPQPTRVLVFTVDDAHLCIDLDRVEAVHERRDTPLYSVKTRAGTRRSFLIHRHQPALITDLREAFGLADALGATQRYAFIITRAGSFPIAVQVDALVGVHDLDLGLKAPIPAALQRDGGFSVGHLITLEGRVLTLLEPTRMLGTALREELQGCLREAVGFCERERELTAVAAALRRDATPAGLRAYARLARRNGHHRTTAAVRTVLQAVQDAEHRGLASAPIGGDLSADLFVRDLVILSLTTQSGTLGVEFANGESGTVFLVDGRIVDASLAGESGHAALKHILSRRDGSYRFEARAAQANAPRIQDAPLWVLVEVVEQLSEQRRSRQGR